MPTRVTLSAVNPDRFSLGLAYLESSVRARLGERVAVRQRLFDSAQIADGDGGAAERIAERLCDDDPDIVGLSWYCWSHELMQEVACAVAERRPHCQLVVGGPEASTIDDDELLAFPAGTLFAFGEGERVLGDLVEAWRAETHALPSGAGRRERDRIVRAARPPRPVAPSEIPSPVLTGTLAPASSNWLPSFATSRGCIYSCSFCAWQDGHSERRFPLPRVLDELAMLSRAGYERVWITDTIFGRDEDRALAVLEQLERWPPATRFALELHARFVSDRLAAGLARIPLAWAALGIQSLAPGILRLTRRSPRTAQLLAAVQRLYDRLPDRSAIHLDLIFGLPEQTLDDCFATIDALLERFPDATLFTSMLQVLPGTEFEALRHEPGWDVLSPREDCEVVSTPSLDLDAVRRLSNAVVGLDAHTIIRNETGRSPFGATVDSTTLERAGESLAGTAFAASPAYGRRERFRAAQVADLLRARSGTSVRPHSSQVNRQHRRVL